jgi:nucleoside-diphosphate-sugar epimerase
MKQIALVGINGYIGSALFEKLQKNKKYNVTGVTRDNYSYFQKRSYDLVINAAMPSKRLWAEQNPLLDFDETVKKTADLVYTWQYKKFIQISTISARSELDRVYGRNKAAAERICLDDKNLIFRLTSTFGDRLTKGSVIDILNGQKVWVDGRSRYSFASLEFVTSWISENLDRKGIVEVGARNSLSLERIAHYLGVKVSFQGKVDHQIVKNPLPEFPDAREILKYLKMRINKI